MGDESFFSLLYESCETDFSSSKPCSLILQLNTGNDCIHDSLHLRISLKQVFMDNFMQYSR